MTNAPDTEHNGHTDAERSEPPVEERSDHIDEERSEPPVEERSDPPVEERSDPPVERGELVTAWTPDGEPAAEEPQHNAVTEPAKVMRIGSMVKQLLEEVRHSPLDEASRERLAEIYERSVAELAEALSPDLQEELRTLALPFEDDEVPTDGELRIAQAQLVGWLEGLFHGIQATLFAQQLAARQQLEQMRQLPQGAPPGAHGQMERPGTYL